MAKVNLINKDSLPGLFDSVTDTVVKGIDELDLFNYDGIISAIPLGKIMSFVVKKVIQIKEPEVALSKAISTSTLLAYIDGLRKYDINPVVEDIFLKEALKDLKKKNSNKKFGYLNFDINAFNKNEISKHSQKLLDEFSNKILSKNEALKIKKHLKDYHKQYFLRLLDDSKIVFEKISSYFDKGSYDEIIVNIKKENYRTALSNQIFEIILNDQKGLRLSDIYIEPEFNIHKNCFLDNDTRIANSQVRDDKGFIKIEKESIHDFVYSYLLGKPVLNLKNKDANVLFILGYPGQGKSSFCKKLLFDSISGQRVVDKDIYFIKFRNITNTSDLIYSPINTLYDHLTSQIDFELSKADFKNSILVLDGLDELFMKENLQFSSIDEFCRALIRDIESNELPKIIITSRYGYINTERLKTENALVFQLREFDIERQIKWLTIFTQFHPETLLTHEKLKQINETKKYSYLRELINQPILLHLIATLEEDIKIETNRAKIYENLFTQLIKRNWAKEGQIDNLIGIKQEDLREFLREVSFAIFLSDNEYINKSTLTTLPSTKKFLDKLQNKELQDSLKRIMIAFYFQEIKKGEKDETKDDKNDYAIEFLHKSLQEYLVAEKIWDAIIFFIDKNSRTGKFNIDDEKVAFDIINNLFSKRFLSKEIANYIKEIMFNDNLIDKSILANRLECFFPLFLESDFLPKNELNSEKNLLMSAFSNFYGFWLLLSNCEQKRNLIPNDFKDKFAFFLRFFTKQNSGLDISFQDLSGANLEGVNLSNSQIRNTNFSQCSLEGANLTWTYITDSNFEKANLYRATFENSILDNANFKDASLVNAIFYHVDIRTCIFLGASLKATIFIATNLKNVSFENCSFEHTNLLESSEQSYEQFQNSIFLDDNYLGLSKSIVTKLKAEKKLLKEANKKKGN